MLREKIANKAMRFLCKDIAIQDRFSYPYGSALEGTPAPFFGMGAGMMAGFCGNVIMRGGLDCGAVAMRLT